jgi:hypothetical protein
VKIDFQGRTWRCVLYWGHGELCVLHRDSDSVSRASYRPFSAVVLHSFALAQFGDPRLLKRFLREQGVPL